MTEESVMTEEDVSAIVNLLGEVITCTGDTLEKRRRVMDGICQIIGGDAWAWSILHFEEGIAPRQLLALHGGFSESRLAKWATVIEDPQVKPLTDVLVSEAIAGGKGFTRRDQEFVPKEWWNKSIPAYQLWTDADLSSFMLSTWPTRNGGFSGIGIYRNTRQDPFTDRETKIAHMVLSEISWLHGEGFDGEDGKQLVTLYPRHRTVLNLLCEGWDRKKISEHLGLSINTVHGYTKAVLKHFNTHSQAELVARFYPQRRERI